ncbi:universal stress protein [Dongia soli]|uniref:Universal stress protein n=1 Tax=Dongia soli TaxID=600628 RepID=A0ABU5E916_9PROT|nr:universal stress protein [Dongia soli]MDY0882095.1 universal stress protein [Dongia soli]
MMTSGLLCATDGSAISEKAVVYAAELARSQQQHLAFLTVVTGSEDQHPMVWDEKRLRAGDLPPDRELLSALSVATHQELQHLTCVRVHGRNPAAAIVSYAEKNNYHHIIAGSAGLTGAKRLLLGSVAADIVTRAHCPVTIVR